MVFRNLNPTSLLSFSTYPDHVFKEAGFKEHLNHVRVGQNTLKLALMFWKEGGEEKNTPKLFGKRSFLLVQTLTYNLLLHYQEGSYNSVALCLIYAASILILCFNYLWGKLLCKLKKNHAASEYRHESR